MGKRRQKWREGDYFTVPLADGSSTLGQVLSIQKEALNSVVCVFSNRRLWGTDDILLTPFEPKEIVAIQFVTRVSLDVHRWKVVGSGVPLDVGVYFNLYRHIARQFVGTSIIGCGIIVKFMEAYFGLTPWDAFHDPQYLDKLLLSPDRKPMSVVYKT